MGACVKFRQAAAQAACLRFIVDMVNLAAGFISRSAAPADADARCRLDMLRKYAADVRSRCEASGLDAKALEILDRAMHQARPDLASEIFPRDISPR